jgi:hypothetical protein
LVETQTRLFEPAVSRRRNLDKLIPYLERRNAWHEARVGRLDIVVLTAADVLECARAMAAEGSYCYD